MQSSFSADTLWYTVQYVIDKLRVGGVMKNKLRAQRLYRTVHRQDFGIKFNITNYNGAPVADIFKLDKKIFGLCLVET